ncbi:hypothetical protein C0J52_17981 [Blattella germanica]|nr:hypothetical protein C0J52_17981 [Blattella germanica]
MLGYRDYDINHPSISYADDCTLLPAQGLHKSDFINSEAPQSGGVLAHESIMHRTAAACGALNQQLMPLLCLFQTCKTLNCALPGYTCLKTWSAPAPGTSCGDHMWCFHHKCEPIGERPDAMDGNWGEWSGWSSCSRSCGSGIAYQERECNNPIPMNGGRDCKGNKRRHKLCSTQSTVTR